MSDIPSSVKVKVEILCKTVVWHFFKHLHVLIWMDSR